MPAVSLCIKMISFYSRWSCVWALSLAFLVQGHASMSQERESDGPTLAGTVSINVRVVDIYFTVRDRRGQFIPNLPQSEFTALENNVPQNISYFSAEPSAGLTLGLLVDTSPSQSKVLAYQQRVGKAYLRDVLLPKDSALIATVDSSVRIVQDLTHEKPQLERAIDSLKVGDPTPGLRDQHAGNAQIRGTIVRDAIHIISEQRFAHEHGRKALIVLTDGEDFGSQLDIAQAIRAAQLADVICYVLLMADPHYYYSIGYNESLKGEGEMKKLASQTGGKLIKVGAKIERLQAAFDLIANELRHHYSIGYAATDKSLDGSFRRLAIKTKHGYKIQVRDGYYALP